MKISKAESAINIPNSDMPKIFAPSVPVTDDPREANITVNLVKTAVKTPAKIKPFATSLEDLIKPKAITVKIAPMAIPKNIVVLVCPADLF